MKKRKLNQVQRPAKILLTKPSYQTREKRNQKVMKYKVLFEELKETYGEFKKNFAFTDL